MRIIYTTLLLTLSSAAYCQQGLFPLAVPYPETGFDQIKNENPYIIEQTKDNNGNWANYTMYSWEVANVAGYKALNGTHSWTDNNWKIKDVTKDTFVLNSDGTIATAWENHIYNYSETYKGNDKLRYAYTYTTDKKMAGIKCDFMGTGPGSNYQPWYQVKISYNNDGRRQFDTVTYSTGTSPYSNAYAYDNNNRIIAEYRMSLNGDTTYKVYNTYENGQLSIRYAEALNQTTKVWNPERIDTLTFTNGKVTRRITYGRVAVNGNDPVFQPSMDELYAYTDQDHLSLIESKTYLFGSWRPYRKFEFLYNNGKPSIGFMYISIGGGAYEQEPYSQFLFASNTGIKKQTGNNNMIGNVYPNPAKDRITVALNGNVAKGTNYFIYDCTGKLVLNGEAHTSEIEVALDGLKSGIYSLKLVSGSGVSTRKFMIGQ